MSGVFVCKECGAVLENRGHLLAHYRQVHPKTERKDTDAATQVAEGEPAGESPDHEPSVEMEFSGGGDATQQPAATGAKGKRVVIPWEWLPAEMRVLSNGRPIVFRGVGLVNHDAGGIVLSDFEVQ